MELTQEQKEIGKNFTAQQLTAYNTYRASGDAPDKAFGLTLSAYPIAEVKSDKNIVQKITSIPSEIGKFATSITGGEKILEATGQIIASPFINNLSEQTRTNAQRVQEDLIARINLARSTGDTARVARLSSQLTTLDYGANIQKGFQDNLVTNAEVVGDAVKLASTATGLFAGGAALNATGSLVKAGSLEGLIQGLGFGVGEAIQEETKINEAVEKVLLSGGLGLVGGAVFGKIIPAVGRGTRKLRDYFKKGATDIVPTIPPGGSASGIVVDDIVDEVVGTTNSAKEAVAKGLTEEQFVKGQGKTGIEVRDKTGIKLQDPHTAEYLPVNKDGTITVYHSTTKEGANKIRQDGLLGSKVESGDIYFTTNRNGYGGIGKDKDTVLAFNVDPNKIKFDDVYRGELHLKGNNADIGGIKPIELKTTSQLRTEYQAALKAVENKESLVVSAERNLVNPTISRTASKRGFNDIDSNFIASLDDNQKAFAKKAIELAETAQTDKRALYGSRPIDIVGDNLVNKVTPIKKLSDTFGEKVDEVAKELRGKEVDNSQLITSLQVVLDNQGITLKGGKWDFSNSVYKNTPTIQNELGKAFDSILNLPDDAFQTHIFKKSIDEIVDFGTQGEGLKGTSANILKGLRREADQLLDTNFSTYKLANDNYKVTRDLIEEVEDNLGKNLNKEKAAAKLRAIFSNRETRGNIKNTIAKIDEIAKRFGVDTTDNLLDQALFTEILEDLYGTQAITSLRGEVEKAVGGLRAVVDGIRDPIRGIGNIAGEVIERVSGQTENARRQFLKDIFK